MIKGALLICLLSAQQSYADFSCTNEMQKRGCRTEWYDCSRPTHYTCKTCVCPTSALVLTEEMIDTNTESLSTQGGVVCKKIKNSYLVQCCDKNMCWIE